MRQLPGPEPLVPACASRVAAHATLDLAQREHVVVDGVKVLALPAGLRAHRADEGRQLPVLGIGLRVRHASTPTGTNEIPGDDEFADHRRVDRRRGTTRPRRARTCKIEPRPRRRSRSASDTRQRHQVPRRRRGAARRSTTIRRAATRTSAAGHHDRGVRRRREQRARRRDRRRRHRAQRRELRDLGRRHDARHARRATPSSRTR